MSETLLFRYYGNKAVLFDEVVLQPFNRLLQDFLAQRPTSTDPRADEHFIFTAVYDLIEQNRALFTALLSARGPREEAGSMPQFEGLISFFRAGTAEELQKYADRGEVPSFDVGLGLRLAFGMLAASVLLRDWLFPEGAPSNDQIVSLLEGMVGRALDPGPGTVLSD